MRTSPEVSCIRRRKGLRWNIPILFLVSNSLPHEAFSYHALAFPPRSGCFYHYNLSTHAVTGSWATETLVSVRILQALPHVFPIRPASHPRKRSGNRQRTRFLETTSMQSVDKTGSSKNDGGIASLRPTKEANGLWWVQGDRRSLNGAAQKTIPLHSGNEEPEMAHRSPGNFFDLFLLGTERAVPGAGARLFLLLPAHAGRKVAFPASGTSAASLRAAPVRRLPAIW